MRLFRLLKGLGVVTLLACSSVLAAEGKEARRGDRHPLVRGKITAVNPDARQITVRDKDDKEWKLTMDDDSRLRLQGRPAKLSEFKKGDRVRVRYEKKDGKNHVVLMRKPGAARAVARTVREALRTARAYGHDKKAEFQLKLQKAVDDLDDRLDDLQEQAENTSGEARKKADAEMKELRKKRRALREKLAKVKAAAPGAWEDAKSGVSDALDDLEKAYEKARSRIK
jgi:hypothetical protein